MVVCLGFLSGLFALAEVCSDLLAEFIAVFGVPKSLRWCTLIYTSMGLNLCLLVVVTSSARKRFQTAMLGLLLMLGITLGAWGLTEIMTNRISELREDISNLKSQQERLKMSVSIFQQKT